MLPPDQRDHLAEPLAVQVDQRLAVPVLFLGHPVEHLGGIRVILPQHLRIRPVDAPVILFRGDRKREDFLFVQVRKTASGRHTGNHGQPLSLE